MISSAYAHKWTRELCRKPKIGFWALRSRNFILFGIVWVLPLQGDALEHFDGYQKIQKDGHFPNAKKMTCNKVRVQHNVHQTQYMCHNTCSKQPNVHQQDKQVFIQTLTKTNNSTISH